MENKSEGWTWYENGSIRCKPYYVDGKKSGVWMECYNRNGIKISEGNYICGIYSGPWIDYDECGNIIRTTYYQKRVRR